MVTWSFLLPFADFARYREQPVSCVIRLRLHAVAFAVCVLCVCSVFSL